MTEITKICFKCKEEKTLDGFYSGKATQEYKHNVDYYCKVCRTGSTLKSQRSPGKFQCGLEDCDRRHYAKGYCRTHYDRMMRKVSLTSTSVNRPLDDAGFRDMLKFTYNLTVEQWKEFAKDGCNVCSATSSSGLVERKLHVDHDHACCPGIKSCGKCVRGVVCNRCNSAIGVYEGGRMRQDYPNREKIIGYLVNYDIRRKREEAN